jgi:hypothetical protein
VKRNECVDAALAELAAAGIRDVERSYGGRHQQIRWRANGHGSRIYTLPISPSDYRADRNVRADIRRMLREDGMLPAAPPKPPVPSKPPDRLAELERRVAALERALGALAKVAP